MKHRTSCCSTRNLLFPELHARLHAEHVRDRRRLVDRLHRLRSHVAAVQRLMKEKNDRPDDVEVDFEDHIQSRVRATRALLTRMRSANRETLVTLAARERELEDERSTTHVQGQESRHVDGVGDGDQEASTTKPPTKRCTGIKGNNGGDDLTLLSATTANNIGEKEEGERGAAATTDDVRPPRQQKPKSSKRGSTAAGWSDEDHRVFTREVTKWMMATRKRSRQEVVDDVWAATSGRVTDRAEVEAMLGDWLREQEKRQRVKDVIMTWKEQKLQQQQIKQTLSTAADEEKKPIVTKKSDQSDHERIREWRELKDMKRQLDEADKLASRLNASLRLGNRNLAQKVAATNEGSSSSSIKTWSAQVDNACHKELHRIDCKLLTENARRPVQQGSSRGPRDPRGPRRDSPDAPALQQGLVLANRDPGRLLRPTASSVSRMRANEASALTHIDIDQVNHKARPTWMVRGVKNSDD